MSAVGPTAPHASEPLPWAPPGRTRGRGPGGDRAGAGGSAPDTAVSPSSCAAVPPVPASEAVTSICKGHRVPPRSSPPTPLLLCLLSPTAQPPVRPSDLLHLWRFPSGGPTWPRAAKCPGPPPPGRRLPVRPEKPPTSRPSAQPLRPSRPGPWNLCLGVTPSVQPGEPGATIGSDSELRGANG